jgi:hypothetical protein
LKLEKQLPFSEGNFAGWSGSVRDGDAWDDLSRLGPGMLKLQGGITPRDFGVCPAKGGITTGDQYKGRSLSFLNEALNAAGGRRA